MSARDDRAPSGATGPFGLDAAETALLAELLGEASAPLGVDGARVVEALAQGRGLGAALDLPPGLPDLLYARAHARFAVGRHAQAGALFRALCLLDGGVADYWVGHGICLRLSGHEEEARLAFSTAVALRPGWAVARFHAASLAAALSDWTAVAAHLEAFERAGPAGVPDDMLRDAARLRLAETKRREARAAPSRVLEPGGR